MKNFAFVHGGGQGSWVWAETIAAITLQSSESPNCLALDVPGCGNKRTRSTAAISIDQVARELVDDIVHSGMRDVMLVGHSQAGTVIPKMLSLAANLFSRVIYVTCIAPFEKTLLEQMGDGLHGERDDVVGWPIDIAAASSEQRLFALFGNDMNSETSSSFFPKLGKDKWPDSTYEYRDYQYDQLPAVDSRYIICMRDRSLTPPWQERFAQRLRVNGIYYIDAGHQVMNTRPHSLAEMILHN